MANIDYKEILEIARQQFNEGNYKNAESLLGQIILANSKIPDVYYMLATIHYDRGKFQKAIELFKKALEINPAFTDASIGLSILLNDLGRYDEGKEVFSAAQKCLEEKSKVADPFMEEKLAKKHEELAQMYFNYYRYKDALEQYLKALNLTTRKPEMTMKTIECLVAMGSMRRAIKDLRYLIRDYPRFVPARLYLGKLLYNSSRIAEAVEQWEGVLLRDPNNSEANTFLKIAQHASVAPVL